MRFDSFNVNIFVFIMIIFDVTRLVYSIFVFEFFSKQNCHNSADGKIIDIGEFEKITSFRKDDLKTVGGMQNYIVMQSFRPMIRIAVDLLLAYYLIWGSFN